MSAILNHFGAVESLSAKRVPWTRVDRRRVTKPALVAAFTELAPSQMADLMTAVELRDVGVARACALDLSGSLNAVGARTLSKLLEALRSDIAARDWIVADTRVAAIQSYLATIVSVVTSRAD